MDDISKQIDSIVREVVRRLKQDEPKSMVSHSNYVSNRVVTLAQIENRLDGTEEIAVRADAVVTPAVKDLLREKSVRLVRRSIGEKAAQPMLVGICDGELSPNCVAKELNGLDIPTDVFVEQIESRLIERIATVSQRDSVVIASRPYKFSCEANRNVQIRAIVAHDESSAARAKREASANVLVLDSKSICPRIVRSFCGAS